MLKYNQTTLTYMNAYDRVRGTIVPLRDTMMTVLKRFTSRHTWVWVLLMLAAFFMGSESRAEVSWIQSSEFMFDRRVHFLEIHPDDTQILYAGVPGRLYRSKDAGKTWKGVLELRSASSKVHAIRIHRVDTQSVFVGSDEGLYASRNGGKSWKRIFYRPDEQEERVRTVATSLESPHVIFVGAEKGLFVTHDGGKRWLSLPQFQELSVYQIDRVMKEPEVFMVAASDGVYVSESGFMRWTKVYEPHILREASSEEIQGNAQFAREENSLRLNSGVPISFVAVSGEPWPRITVFEKNDIFYSEDMGRAWQTKAVNTFPGSVSQKPLVLSHNEKMMFVPTEAGIFVYDATQQEAMDISWGLPTKKINSVVYSTQGDMLYAGTEKGIFKMPHPEISLYLEERYAESDEELGYLMSAFDHEPTIRELQEVAMRYAEVHPEKILEWRRAAKQSAWLPKVGISYDQNTDEVIEIDRGGTKDPDRFIFGPDEKNTDWSVDLSWEISEIIWNPAQTTIDIRSKLMVQLRDDILNQLTHLYFARRRLQLESITRPPSGLDEVSERELQIQEYTAGIDALTGGYFSSQLGPTLKTHQNTPS